MNRLTVENRQGRVGIWLDVDFTVRKHEDHGRGTVYDVMEARWREDGAWIGAIVLSNPLHANGMRMTQDGFETNGAFIDEDGSIPDVADRHQTWRVSLLSTQDTRVES